MGTEVNASGITEVSFNFLLFKEDIWGLPTLPTFHRAGLGDSKVFFCSPGYFLGIGIHPQDGSHIVSRFVGLVVGIFPVVSKQCVKHMSPWWPDGVGHPWGLDPVQWILDTEFQGWDVLTQMIPLTSDKPPHCWRWELWWEFGPQPRSRWWFQIFLFSPLFGEDFHFDKYFSDGLNPPTRDDAKAKNYEKSEHCFLFSKRLDGGMCSRNVYNCLRWTIYIYICKCTFTYAHIANIAFRSIAAICTLCETCCCCFNFFRLYYF